MAKPGAEKFKSETRRGGARPLSSLVQPLAKKALGKKGRAFAAFLADWPAVVGEEVARHCLPQKLSFPDREERREGKLTLRVASQAWATELQHQERQLLEKINVYFGYSAVTALRFTSGPLPGSAEDRRERLPARKLDGEERRALEERLSAVSDPELKEALRRLGERVLARR